MRPSMTAALWAVFTVAAVATGLGAVTIVRDALTTPAADTLTPSQVVAELATTTPRASTTPEAAPAPTATAPQHTPSSGASSPAETAPTSSSGGSTSTLASPSEEAASRTLASRGGTVVARCTDSEVYLSSWSPAPGYRVEDVARGPGTKATVWFEGPYEVTLNAVCVAGVPVAQVNQEVNDGSG